MKKSTFVVTLVADLRPLVLGLNRALLDQGAEPVQRAELSDIDRMLHEGFFAGQPASNRCGHCGGYIYGEAGGDDACLNCGRPLNARGLLEDVIPIIALDLIERRRESDGAVRAKPARVG